MNVYYEWLIYLLQTWTSHWAPIPCALQIWDTSGKRNYLYVNSTERVSEITKFPLTALVTPTIWSAVKTRKLDAVSGVWFGRLETPIPWCDWLNQTKCPPPTHIVCTVHILSTNPPNTTMTNVKQKRIWAEIYISPANQMQIFRSLSEIFKSSRFRPKKFRHSCYFSSALGFPSVRLLLLQPWAVCLSPQRLM